jgi:ankyrin repeat protein
LEVGEALLKSGSPVDVKDSRGNTPLDLARKCTQGSSRQLQAKLEFWFEGGKLR